MTFEQFIKQSTEELKFYQGLKNEYKTKNKPHDSKYYYYLGCVHSIQRTLNYLQTVDSFVLSEEN